VSGTYGDAEHQRIVARSIGGPETPVSNTS
jgi:hypothetical protein